MTGSATQRPLGFMLASGIVGGAALITVEWATTRGPLVLLAYGAMVLATAAYLRVERVQGWRRRFVLTLGSFMSATLLLYAFIGLVLTRTLFVVSASGHAWRLGLMLGIGCALSAAVAQLTATRPAE